MECKQKFKHFAYRMSECELTLAIEGLVLKGYSLVQAMDELDEKNPKGF